MRTAYVYAGPGSDAGCVAALLQLLRQLAPGQGWRVAQLGCRALRQGGWRRDAALLCMPGGRDLPYLRRLRGAGVAHIRSYVRLGGRYFGSCAGAYFAASALQFRAAKVPPVCGPRPLRFFAGVAVGPSQAAADFAYHGAGGRALLPVRCLRSGQQAAIFNRGGCVFVAAPAGRWPLDAQVWATAPVALPLARERRPRPRPLPVAVRVQVGRGAALLWGAHPELDPDAVTKAAASAAAPVADVGHKLLVGHLQAFLSAR